MSDLNNCSFIGRVTKDAELKHIGAKQTPCAEFTIANNTGYGQFEKTSYINVQLWGTSATNLISYLTKGKQVAVAGVFAQNDWVDSNGVKHSTWRLTADKCHPMASPKQASSDAPQAEYPSTEDVAF